MTDSAQSLGSTPRVRFAPSPTGFLHVGSARTFIFNWLYARHNGGTMILRLDDTDLERNTQASVDSIFEGLKWLNLGWDEEYKQSERIDLHRKTAWHIFEKVSLIGISRRRIPETRKNRGRRERGSSIPALASFHGKKATAAQLRESPLPCAFACRENGAQTVGFADAVYGEQAKAPMTLRISRCFVPTACRPTILPLAPTTPTFASRTSSADRTIFRTLSSMCSSSKPRASRHQVCAPAIAGRSRWDQAFQAPSWASRQRDHVSRCRISARVIHQLPLPARLVAQERSREHVAARNLFEVFSLEGINRSNAVVNFKESGVGSANSSGAVSPSSSPVTTPGEPNDLVNFAPEDTFDPKALWLNAEHIRGSAGRRALSSRLLPIVRDAGFDVRRR